MNSIIRFIIRYQFVLLFLVLETFSFWLLSKHTYYQQSKIENWAVSVSGFANKKANAIGSYFHLRKENNVLAEQNLALRKQIAVLSTQIETLTEDTTALGLDSIYRFIPAKIVNNSVNKRHNFLTLNNGTNHGIETEMGVITSDGVIGIVAGVSPNYSTVISLLNIDLKLSAKLQKSNHFGSLYWEGEHYQQVTLGDIPHHVPISIGDTIVSSGFSSIFPENIPIGVVHDYSVKGSNFQTIKVDLFRDFKKLYNVWIVTNTHKVEIEELQSP